MRINPGETYESWGRRVQQYEYEYALQQITRGQNFNVVMEAMAVRIQQKLLHPVFKVMKESSNVDYDPVAARKSYEESYKSNGGVVDSATM